MSQQLPDGVKVPPGFQLPPGFKITPGMKIPPGLDLPSGFSIPASMTAVPTSLPTNIPASLANGGGENLSDLGIGSSGLPNTFSKIDGDRGTPLVVYNAIFIAIPTICVILRFWSRAVSPRSEKKFQWDDWVTLAALVGH